MNIAAFFRVITTLCIVCQLSGFQPIHAQQSIEPVRLVANINQATSLGSDPYSFMTAGGRMFFFAAGDQDGLWVTDGTSAGTQFVKAVGTNKNPDYIYSRPWSAMLGDTVYFRGYDSTHGNELWRTNGTEAGTRIVADAVSGKDIPPEDLVAFQNQIYFIRGLYLSEFTSAPYLFKADSTDAVTRVTTGTTTKPAIIFKDALYFGAQYQSGTTDYGFEPLRITSASTGPTLFMDLVPGSGSSYSEFLGATDHWLYFSTMIGAAGKKLWATDGTTPNTFMAASIKPDTSIEPYRLIGIGSQVYFAADDGQYGSELWRYDEDTQQASLVLDINSGTASSSPRLIGPLDNQMLFFAKGADGIYDLWVSDGTPGGTHLLKDNDPVVSQFNDANQYQWLEYAIYNGVLYFAGFDAENGMELWRSDGTAAGTARFADVWPGAANAMPKSFTACGQKLCFSANDGDHGAELWATDGTPEGTQLLKDLNTTPTSSNPASFVAAGNKVYFTANDGLHGTELWVTDSQSSGATMVKNIRPDYLVDDAPYYLTPIGDNLFFVVDDGEHGAELWKTSSLTGQTELVKDIYPGAVGGSPFALTVAGGQLYFYARASGSNYELWRSDGTNNGTVQVTELFTGASGVYRGGMVVLNSRIILYGRSSDSAYTQIWSWDYTTPGAPFTLLKSMPSTAMFIRCNGRVFFQAITNFYWELWETDGSVVGTKKVLPVAGTILKDTVAAGEADINGVLFFFGNNDKGPALFRTTGSESGIVQVKALPILSGSSWVYPIRIDNLDGQAIFTMNYASSGYVLWRSDGTEAGTQPITGSYNTVSGLYVRVSNHKIIFSAQDADHGSELWVSDGTSAGTTLFADIVPGAASSEPRNFFTVGSRVYFSANDLTHGRELWVYDSSQPLTDILLSRTSFLEGEGIVGTLSLVGPNAEGSGDCVLLDNGGGPFALSGTSLSVTRPLDYEKGPHDYSIRISCTDSQGAAIEKTFNLTVTDQNEGPTITNPAGQVITLSEDGSPLPFQLTLTAVDEDANTTLQWELQSAPHHGTALVNGTGFSKAIDYMPATDYFGTDEFVVQVSDGSLTSTYSVSVDIQAVNDLPTLDALSDVAIHQNTGEQVIQLTGIGVGPANETEGLSITVDTDRPDLFSALMIQYSGGSTGMLKFLPKPGLNGTAIITITVDDGQPVNHSAVRTFQAAISSLNKIYLPVLLRE